VEDGGTKKTLQDCWKTFFVEGDSTRSKGNHAAFSVFIFDKASYNS
jgi:hypothetical protein